MPKSFDIQPKRPPRVTIPPLKKEQPASQEKKPFLEILPLLPLGLILTSPQGSGLVFYTVLGSLLYYLCKYYFHYSIPKLLQIIILLIGVFFSLVINLYFFELLIPNMQVVIFLLLTALLISYFLRKKRAFSPVVMVFVFLMFLANFLVSPFSYNPTQPSPLVAVVFLLAFIPLFPGPKLSLKTSLVFVMTLIIISLTSSHNRLLQPLLADVHLIFIALLCAYFTIGWSVLFGREIARHWKFLFNFHH